MSKASCYRPKFLSKTPSNVVLMSISSLKSKVIIENNPKESVGVLKHNAYLRWNKLCSQFKFESCDVKQLCSYMFLYLQEVFPVQYGAKFDTALQALVAGLVCKLEQLLPVPNLSQVCTFTIVAL